MTKQLLMASLLFVGFSSLGFAQAKATSTIPQTISTMELIKEDASAGQYIYEVSFTNHSNIPIRLDTSKTQATTERGESARVGLMDREWEKPIPAGSTFVGLLGFEISPQDKIKEVILR